MHRIAAQSVHQPCQLPLEPRPLPAATGFVLVCVPVSRHFFYSPSVPTALLVPASSRDDGRDPEHGRLKLGQRVPGEFAIYSEHPPPPPHPPRGAARTRSPPGTCLPPCLWKIYGCLRRLWYLNTTNDAGAFARSRLERRRRRRLEKC